MVVRIVLSTVLPAVYAEYDRRQTGGATKRSGADHRSRDTEYGWKGRERWYRTLYTRLLASGSRCGRPACTFEIGERYVGRCAERGSLVVSWSVRSVEIPARIAVVGGHVRSRVNHHRTENTENPTQRGTGTRQGVTQLRGEPNTPSSTERNIEYTRVQSLD